MDERPVDDIMVLKRSGLHILEDPVADVPFVEVGDLLTKEEEASNECSGGDGDDRTLKTNGAHPLEI